MNENQARIKVYQEMQNMKFDLRTLRDDVQRLNNYLSEITEFNKKLKDDITELLNYYHLDLAVTKEHIADLEKRVKYKKLYIPGQPKEE